MEDRKSNPTWAYKGDEAKLFDHPDDVPKGWNDSPAKPAAPKKVKPVEQPETQGDES